MGLLSDRSRSPIGRRRPFIFIGTLSSLILLGLIGYFSGFSGLIGYWILFSLLILLSIASNTSQAGLQGLFTDLVPDALQGRFSGVKAFFEIPLPMVIIAAAVAPLVSQGKLWSGILIAMGMVLAAMVLTMMTKEIPSFSIPERINWQPFLRLISMTGIFTLAIVLSGFFVQKLLSFVIQSGISAAFYPLAAAAGLTGMIFPILVGVWISIRIGLGASGKWDPAFTWWVINRLAFLAGATNLGSFAIYFLQDRLGLIREQAAAPAGRLLMLVGVFILLTAIPAGWLADRINRKSLVAFAGILAALGTVVVLASPSLLTIYIGGAIIGAAAGLFFSASWALGIKLVPADHAGFFLGIANLAGAGAGAIGAYIGGPLADQVTQFGSQNAGRGYVLLFAIFGVLFLFSAFAVQFISKPVRISRKQMENPIPGL
jgi:MFS family permease